MTASTATTAALEPHGGHEREIRTQLAACYRLMPRFGMTDLIYTHVSARLPGAQGHFLLNPYGLLFNEITASSLVEVDAEGDVVGDSEWGVNHAGYVIHSAILDARDDVNCVLHTHTRAGVAVSALACGLLPISQHALLFHDRIGYHDYEGFACDLDERKRLAADLGGDDALILRNHGLITVGRSVGAAFVTMYTLEMACKAQIDAMRTGAELVVPSAEVREATARQFTRDEDSSTFDLAWDALVRQLDREEPDYRD